MDLNASDAHNIAVPAPVCTCLLALPPPEAVRFLAHPQHNADEQLGCFCLAWLTSELMLFFSPATHAITLQVAKEPKTANWQLYLVDWGYNTPPERAAAAAHPKITVVDIDGFKQVLHTA